MKKRYYYYFDEKNDDFAGTNINGEKTPKNYEYLPRNIFYRIFKPVVLLSCPADCFSGCYAYGRADKEQKSSEKSQGQKKGLFYI